MTFGSLWKYVHITIAAGFFGLLIYTLSGVPIAFLFDGSIEIILACILWDIAATLFCLFSMKKCGYDDSFIEKPLVDRYTVIRICFAVAFFLLLVVCVSYSMIGVNACHIAHYLGNIEYGIGIGDMAKQYPGWMFLSLLIQDLPFVPAMIGGYVWGGWVRRREKAAFRKSEQQKIR